MDQSRIKFTKDSLKRACNFNDEPLIKFIILWIGLNALYHDENIRGEKKKVKTYFKNNKNLVFGFLRDNRKKLDSIVKFIENTPQHRKLSKFIKSHRSFLRLNDPESSTDHFAEFLYKVRNNMFHAAKVWDEENEARLLLIINPILEKLIVELTRNFY